MKIHKACIARLFERNDLVLDAETIADVARESRRRRRAQPERRTSCVVGVSTRAMAASAVTAGFDVACHRRVRRPRSPGTRQASVDVRHQAAGTALAHEPAPGLARPRRPSADAVAYASNIDNDPRAVAALARGRTLWGNPPDALRRARDPGWCATRFAPPGTRRPDRARCRQRPVRRPAGPGCSSRCGPAAARRAAVAARPRAACLLRAGVRRRRSPARSCSWRAPGGRAARRSRGSSSATPPSAPAASATAAASCVPCAAADGAMRGAQPPPRGGPPTAFGLVGVGGVDFIARPRGASYRGEPAVDGVDGAGRTRARPLGVRPARRGVRARRLAGVRARRA